jgi:hypothetical protein
MKRETIADLWALGMVLLALTLIMPLSWLDLEDESADTGKIATYGIVPFKWFGIDEGSAMAVVFIGAAVLIGCYSSLGYFRWSIDRGDLPWGSALLSIFLLVLALVVFACVHSMYGRGFSFDGTGDLHTLHWYPSIGFYLTALSVLILSIVQVLAYRLSSKRVRKIINIREL